MHWEIHLDGEEEVLNLLSSVAKNEQRAISKRDGVYILRSHQIDQLQDAKEVSRLAREMIGRFSSSIRLHRGDVSIKMKAIFQILDDGRKLLILEPDPIVGKTRAYISSIDVIRADGRVENWNESIFLRQLLKLDEENEEVAKVLRLRDSGDLNWVDLYRIYEVMEKDVIALGISKKAITKFTRTANSVSASGDHSRHGVEKSQPPKNPMSLHEAKDLIDTIIKSWTNSKLT